MLTLQLRALAAMDVRLRAEDAAIFRQDAEQVGDRLRTFAACVIGGIPLWIGAFGSIERGADGVDQAAADLALDTQPGVPVQVVGKLARAAARHAAQRDERFERGAGRIGHKVSTTRSSSQIASGMGAWAPAGANACARGPEKNCAMTCSTPSALTVRKSGSKNMLRVGCAVMIS